MHLEQLLGEILHLLAFIGSAYARVLPFLAISIPISIALRRSGAAANIKTKLTGKPVIAVIIATLVGAMSPLCSCGVIPMIAALLTAGVPLAPVMSFWLASPSMDPEILFLSAGTLGWPLAVWRLAVTFAISLGSGLVVIILERRKVFGDEYLRSSIDSAGCAKCGAERPKERAAPRLATARQPRGQINTAASKDLSFAAIPPVDCGCGPSLLMRTGSTAIAGKNTTHHPANATRKWIRSILSEAGRTGLVISLWMLVAFALEALITRYFPTELAVRFLGEKSPWAIPLATAIGIPLYTSNLSALGIVGGLMARGMSGGAALAFLVGGAITTIPAMSAVWGIVRKKVFAAYLGFGIAGSLIAGFAYQLADIAFR